MASSGNAATDTIIPLNSPRTIMTIGYSAVMTPSGRLLRRSAQPADRPAVFAALACMLAADVSAGGMAWVVCWNRADGIGVGRPYALPRGACVPTLDDSGFRHRSSSASSNGD